MKTTQAKKLARDRVELAHEALIGLSHWIHANPELGYEEHRACAWVAEWLEKAGFDVEVGVGGLETAVIGVIGSGPLNVSLLVEYDALPEVGHACGHNVIAASSVGAAVALAALADKVGLRVARDRHTVGEVDAADCRLFAAGCALLLDLIVHS